MKNLEVSYRGNKYYESALIWGDKGKERIEGGKSYTKETRPKEFDELEKLYGESGVYKDNKNAYIAINLEEVSKEIKEKIIEEIKSDEHN